MTTALTQAAAERPFVGLAPFTEEEARYFFGRDADRAVIVSNMVASRLTVLYGPSGCGKSSLLDAGVLNEVNKIVSPRQIAAHGTPEYVVASFHEWRDRPRDALLAGLHERIKGVLGRDIPAPQAGASLADALADLSQHVRGALLIVLDQFEEYFLYHERKVVQGKFAFELAAAVNRADLRANFLISVREDALAQLDALEGYVANLMANTLRLDRLDRKRGRHAVVGPIDRYNELRAGDGPAVTIEPELIDEVLHTVEAGSINLETTGQGRVDREDSADVDALPIEAAFLQLVMKRLWEEETAHGSQVLRVETFRKLGGAERIVGTHLDTVMKTFEPDRQALAAELFRYLVTPTGTKIALTLNDMVEYTGLARDKVEPVLEQLGSGEVRILREVKGPLGDQATTRHEIFHDVLAGVILDWRRRYSFDQAKRDAARKAEAARLEELQKAEQRRREELAAADAARRRVQIRAVGSLLCVTTVLSTVAIYQAIQADRKAKFARLQEGIAKKQTAFAIEQKSIADEQTKNADDERKKAKDEARASQSSVLAARAASVLDDDPDLSLALALAAMDRKDAPAARLALRKALSASRVRAMVGSVGGVSMAGVAFSRDGKQLATIRHSGHLQVRNLADSGIVHDIHMSLGQAGPKALVFDQAGRVLTVLDDGGAISVIDLASKAIQTTPGAPGSTKLLFHALAPDGSRVAMATDDHRIRVWDARVKKFLSDYSIGAATVTELAFDPLGQIIAFAVDATGGHEGPTPPPVTYAPGTTDRPGPLAQPGLAAPASRFKVHFIRVADGSELPSIPCDAGPVTALAWEVTAGGSRSA